MSEPPSRSPAGNRVIALLVGAAVIGAIAAVRPNVITALFSSPQSVAVLVGIVAAFIGLSALLRRVGAPGAVRGAVLGVAVLGVLAWGLLPSFRTVRVDEALPGEPAAADPATAPADTGSTPPPDAAAADLATGTFSGRDGHEAQGTARVVEVDGRTVVRLENFAVTNGPDLRVVLTPAGGEEAAGGTDLGALKGNEGNQNYEVPADVDVTDVGAVLIWCRAFSVPFGAAPLQ